MNTYRFLLLMALVPFLLLTSCSKSGESGEGNDAQTEEGTASDQLGAEVIAVHDVAMARMGEIQSLKSELLKLEKNVEEESELTEIRNHILYLQKANDGMMNWMHQLKVKSDLAEMSEAEKLSYWQEEMKRVGRVKMDIDNSIKDAQTLLGK